MAYVPLHALAVTLGQSSPTHSAVQQIGPVHTLAVQTHPGPSNAPAASSQQYDQSNPTVSPLQASLFPLDSHLHYGSTILTAAHTHPGQTHGAYLVPPGSIATAEPPIQAAQQIRPQKEGQQGIEFRDMQDLINKVDRYASLLKEEMQKRTASKGTYYRNPVVSYAEADGPAEAESDEVEMSSAEVSIDKPFICKGLVKADNSRTKIPEAKFATRETKAYTFDLTRAKAIFDLLLSEKKVKLSFGHKIPKPKELKGKTFCKYHSSWSHNTNNCVVLRDVIQKLIDEKKLQFPEKAAMQVDSKPFPPLVINMVNTQLRAEYREGRRPTKEICRLPNQSRYCAVGANMRSVSTDR
ncbi:unnamed protein product [Prunus brigantina]